MALEVVMELLVALAVFVVVDVLALRFGVDSRPVPRRFEER